MDDRKNQALGWKLAAVGARRAQASSAQYGV